MQYSCVLPADYADPTNKYHFLNELQPHLYFKKQNGDETINYLLENFELTLPRYQLRKRIKNYVEYLDDWNNKNGPAPIALMICATTADLLYVKRRARWQIEESGNEDIKIRVATLEKIRATGVASMIWEDV